MTVDSITLSQQENKFKVYKTFITFKVYITFFDFSFFSRKQTKYQRLCYLSLIWFSIVSLKFQIKDGSHFNFLLLQKYPKNDYFNLETLACCWINFMHININNLLSKKKIKSVRCINNKSKAAIIGIAKPKIDHTVSDIECRYLAHFPA